MLRRIVPAIGAAAAAAALGAAPAPAKTIDVHPGDSIQRAVDRAHPGDVIKVHAGAYRGAVEIKKDDLTLKGAGARRKDGTVIRPRRNKRTPCGFCVGREHGKPTSGTRIRGFMFRDFTQYGAEAEGTKDTVFIHDKFIDNRYYGVAAFGSTRTKFLHDVAVGAQTAGFYVGESRRARTVFKDDTARDTGRTGYLVRDASRGRIVDSAANGNCIGIMLLNEGDTAGIPVSGWSVRDNDVRHNNLAPKVCRGEVLGSASGIALLGAKKNSIVGNEVVANGTSEPAPFPGGIAVFSSEPNFSGAVSAQNVIKENDAHRNSPADIVWDGNGKGNQFVDNNCDSSMPSGLCQ